MSSKWRPWDFLKHHPEVIDKDNPGLSVLYCSDPFVERILRNKIDFKNWFGQSALITSAMEFTPDWIEENILTLSLFGSDQPICVLQAGHLNAATKRFILENDLNDSGRHLIVFMNGDKKFFNEWQKKAKGSFLQVEEPMFWEFGKLLTYFADEMSMRLPMNVQNYLLEAVPQKSSDMVNALKSIRLSFGAGPYQLDQIKTIIPPTRLDQFKLASLLGGKKLTLFYRELEKLQMDPEDQMLFFKFLQGHLLKLIDTSYVDKKPRPSKYDKEILAHGVLWEREELQKLIRSFSELEIDAKTKSPYIKEKVRTLLLGEL
ncbi:MAG: DNA polymerase III delta subunit [Bacteriovoracaceae bacterium]|jgi:DNA polymerase III delta subunit